MIGNKHSRDGVVTEHEILGDQPTRYAPLVHYIENNNFRISIGFEVPMVISADE